VTKKPPKQTNRPQPPEDRAAAAAAAMSPPLWGRCGTALIVCLAVCVVSAFVYAGPGFLELIYRSLTDGVFLLLWLVAAYGVGTLVPLPDRSPDSAALRIVSRVALGLGAMSLAALGLGLIGALNRPTTFALVAAGLGICIWRVMRNRDVLATHLRECWNAPAGAGWLWVLVMPLLGVALVAALVPPGVLWGMDEPNGYDVVEYHLQVPREWYEARRIAPLHHNAFSFFPFNVEMHFLLAMQLRGGPWAGMYLAQLMHVGYIALAVAAVYAVARATGGNATVAGVCAAASPWLVMLAPIAYNEGGLLLYGTLAIGWTLVALRDRDRRVAAMAVAGAMAGLACGVKLTGGPMLLVPLPVALIVIAAVRRDASAKAFAAAVLFVAVGVAMFSPWLARNLAWAGNPVFPEEQSLLGRGHFSAVQSERWKAAHSPREDQRSAGARLGAAWEQIIADARFGYALIPFAVVYAALAYRRPETWLLLAMLVLLIVFWLGLTHLQGRFFVLAVPLAALLIAQVRGRVAIAAGVAAALLAVIGLSIVHPRASSYLHDKGLARILGVEALGDLTPQVVNDVPADATLVLVGDAKAFYYQRPMSRLRYRTVFDVTDDADWLTAWAGIPAPNATVLVDPRELSRFGRTYRGLPPAPPEVIGRTDTFILGR
jgi:hypothetical protein